MAELETKKEVLLSAEDKINDVKEQVYLEETFYILSKKNAVFRVRLTSNGLTLTKETDGNSKKQTIQLRDIIGSKCMRSKRRRPGATSCVCSSLAGSQQLKVVEETSGELDENDISAYLYIYAYILKRGRHSARRERTTITLRFRSYDKYDDNNKEAQKWRSTIKCLVAGESIAPTPPSNEKRLLILVNPKSGRGKGREVFQTKVAPILQEAEVPYDMHVTKYAKFAREFVRTRNVYSWKAIVGVGGDGVLYEVLNGMFERLDWQQALSEVPLAIVPCGSGNGLAKTIAHLYNEPYIPQNMVGSTIALARGKTAPMDVVRVETKSEIMFSFLSVGWGLLSDIDIESERLRAIGAQRFTLWAIARLLSLRTYRGVVSYAKIKDLASLPKMKSPLTLSHSVSQDGAIDSPDAEAFVDCDDGADIFTTVVGGKRHQRVDSWYSVNSRRSAFFSTRGSEYHSVTSGGSEPRSPAHACMHGPASRLPSLMSSLPSHWVHERGEFVMVHIAYQSYIGEDFLFAPAAQLSDGVIWMLIIKAGIPRSQLLSFLLNISNGSHAALESEHLKMVPVSAFRIVPEGPNGTLTVDGEIVEYGPIQGEIYPNLVNVIVPDSQC